MAIDWRALVLLLSIFIRARACRTRTGPLPLPRVRRPAFRRGRSADVRGRLIRLVSGGLAPNTRDRGKAETCA